MRIHFSSVCTLMGPEAGFALASNSNTHASRNMSKSSELKATVRKRKDYTLKGMCVGGEVYVVRSFQPEKSKRFVVSYQRV